MALLAVAVFVVVFWLLLAYCLGGMWWVWFGAKFMGILVLLLLFRVGFEEWQRRWMFMSLKEFQPDWKGWRDGR